MTKSWYMSRTLWLNVIAAVAFFVQSQTGYLIDPVYQAMALSGINFVLRFFTKQELTA